MERHIKHHRYQAKLKHPAYRQVEHRPWPLPQKRPLLSQVWRNLLFIHWEVDLEQIRKAIPKPLEIDTFDGKAWIAIVPFDMQGVTFYGLPSVSWLSDFPEINVRTYVKLGEKPGVWFFSLDVPSKLAVWSARTFFHLPYRYASVETIEKSGSIHYRHRIRDTIHFEAHYRPTDPVEAKAGSFEIWATERYCLYCQSKAGSIYRTEVQHPQWPLYTADFDLINNTLLGNWHVGNPHPSVLFSKHIDVLAYAPERIIPA